MKRFVLVLSTAAAVVAATVGVTSPAVGAPVPAATDGVLSDHEAGLLAVGLQLAPKTPLGQRPAGPNPFLANVPDPSTVDYSGWRTYARSQAAAAETSRSSAQHLTAAAVPTPRRVRERERPTVIGRNDTIATAQRVRAVGTDRRDRQAAQILGVLAPPIVEASTSPAVTEDNGSIPLAIVSGVSAEADQMIVSSVIGDGPHGTAASGSGDFDVFAVTLDAGEVMTATTAALAPPPPDELPLDTILVVYDAAGELLLVDDDSGESPLSSRLEFVAPTAGDYYVLVTTFGGGIIPVDPFESGSGLGAGPEGPYDLTISTVVGDVDVYAFDLDAGDVVGATVGGGAGRLRVFDPTGVEVIGSNQDLSFIYPASSPLPGGGNSATAHVVNQSGRHYVSVSTGEGPYEALVEVYRAGQTAGPASVQTIFLDLNGARLNTNIFGGPGVRTLSPLRSFLAGWGLTGADESALIDAIVANVTENVQADLVANGRNPSIDVEILNSRDDADPFGGDNVSRIVVGGTIDQSGIPTIGIAQSIDPGNFGQEDTALVLLDILSGPAQVLEEGEVADDPSLNAYITPATADRIAAVAQGVGNVTSHEAGHFLGNWHTDQFNAQPNLQDQGGNFANLFGTGPDAVLGTADDVDVDFGVDVYVPSEGLTGIEDTLNNVSFGLTPSVLP